MTDLTIVDQGTGFEIRVDPAVVAEALHKVGWTVLPPRPAIEMMALAEQYREGAQPVQTALMTEGEARSWGEAEASVALDQDRTGAHTGRYETHVVEGWHGHTQRSWRGADQSQTLVPEPVDRPGRHRTGDHATSVVGARDVAFRAGTQLHRLLSGYVAAANSDHIGGPERGFTDEQAAEWAGLLRSCFWKRSGELRADGLIETIPGPSPDGVLTRVGSAGIPRIVCRVTEAGTAYLARLAPAR